SDDEEISGSETSDDEETSDTENTSTNSDEEIQSSSINKMEERPLLVQPTNNLFLVQQVRKLVHPSRSFTKVQQDPGNRRSDSWTSTTKTQLRRGQGGNPSPTSTNLTSM